MTVRGKIKNGKVLLNNPKALPEGMEVEVTRAKRRKTSVKSTKTKAKARSRSLAERLANVIGKAVNLPADAAENVDHYLYGAAKRK